jgi:transposase-like protein
MIHAIEIECPHCHSQDLVKNGKSSNGTQKWQRNSCRKHFHLDYRYRAWQTRTKEKIIEMTLNSSGVRDIGRMLHINKVQCLVVCKIV